MEMVFKKKIVSLAVAFAVLFSSLPYENVLAARNKNMRAVVKMDKKNVAEKTYKMVKGKSKTLKVTVTPKAKYTMTFHSDNRKIATVSKKGKVTAKKAGTTKITIRIKSKTGKKISTWVKIKVTSGKQKALGGFSPKKALAYMKKTKNLVIVETNAPEWKLDTGITGSLYIPYTQMAKRYNEIPKGRPVLLYCGGGIVSKKAYKILLKKRPDIPELSYIAGAPPVSAYNKWVKDQTNNTTKPSEKPSSNAPDSQPTNQPDMNSPSPQPTDQPEKEEESVQKLLGGLTPQDALEYMKKTPDLEWRATSAYALSERNDCAGSL